MTREQVTREQATRETGAWFDIGIPESYLDALAWHLDGHRHISPTLPSKIGGSRVVYTDVGGVPIRQPALTARRTVQ